MHGRWNVCSNTEATTYIDVHKDTRASHLDTDTRQWYAAKKENRTNNNTLTLKRARGEHAPLLPQTVHLSDIDARHRIDK